MKKAFILFIILLMPVTGMAYTIDKVDDGLYAVAVIPGNNGGNSSSTATTGNSTGTTNGTTNTGGQTGTVSTGSGLSGHPK
jgi:hypothetical protein